MKNCIRPHYEKLKPLKSGFIENSKFENNRDPCNWLLSFKRYAKAPTFPEFVDFLLNTEVCAAINIKRTHNSWPHNLDQWEERKVIVSLAWELLQVEEYNEHWVPFYLLCTPCHLNYTVVAKTETIEEDSRWTEFRCIISFCVQSPVCWVINSECYAVLNGLK